MKPAGKLFAVAQAGGMDDEGRGVARVAGRTCFICGAWFLVPVACRWCAVKSNSMKVKRLRWRPPCGKGGRPSVAILIHAANMWNLWRTWLTNSVW